MLFFFNAPTTTEIYALSLHDALPISFASAMCRAGGQLIANGRIPVQALIAAIEADAADAADEPLEPVGDRKSTRLNSSHSSISYAVFCLKKKTIQMSNVIASSRRRSP